VLTTQELSQKTGARSAMIELYVTLGVLPKPAVRKAAEQRLSYFPTGSEERIHAVERLRASGLHLAEISLRVRDLPIGPSDAEVAPDVDATPAPAQDPAS
jgi:DNA-binding transcriptional MerR regulator